MYKKLSSILITILLASICSSTFAAESDNKAVQTNTTAQTSTDAANQAKSAEECAEPKDKPVLTGGWYLWPPYQFNQVSIGGVELTGMDIQLTKAIADLVGVKVTYEPVAWQQHQLDLKAGTRDIASGATYTDARAQYVYFSDTYRYEENSLFISRTAKVELSFKSIDEFLAQVRIKNFKLAVIDGFVYADPKVNAFIADDANSDIIIKTVDDTQSLQLLVQGKADGFLADRVVGAAVIIDAKAGSLVKEVPLHIKTPQHFMFSKQTVSTDMVGRFNKAIKQFIDSPGYKEIVRNYLYPVLLLQTINAEWFYVLGIIGTIAFAISGVAISARENYSLFTTLLLAALPSLGGGIIRDIMVNRSTVAIFVSPEYMYYVFLTVLIGLASIRLLYSYTGGTKNSSLLKTWQFIALVGDAIGQSVFIVIGITVAIMAKLAPLALWGPFMAFITSHGGGILRDMFRGQAITRDAENSWCYEISILWGLIFSLALEYYATDPNPDLITNTVIVCVIGAFVSRMLVYKYQIRNIRFRSDE